MIKVFCVDDNPATLNLYQVVFELERDMEYAGGLESTESLTEALEVVRPSILLLDLSIPGCDTLEDLAQIRARFPDLAILVASGHDDDRIVEEAFTHGASGFLLKTTHLADSVAAIRRVVAGECVDTRPHAARIRARESGSPGTELRGEVD